MNLNASEFLKDLQVELENILHEYTSNLEEIPPDQFKYDVTESILGKISGALYEIDTILSDLESGYYSEFLDNNDEDSYGSDNDY